MTNPEKTEVDIESGLVTVREMTDAEYQSYLASVPVENQSSDE